MVQNVTLRVLIGVAVGIILWFLLTNAIPGLTSGLLVVIAVLALAAAVATSIGLGHQSRSRNSSP